MSIVVQCPHCKTRFNLQSEMNGKSMRCPNLDCRQVFTVKAMEEKGPAPSYDLPPEPIHEPPPPPAVKASKPGKPAAGKPPAPSKPPKPPRTAGKPPEPEVVEAVVVEAAVVSPPKVKEVVWSEGTDVPPPKKKGRKAAEEDEAPDDLPVRRRKRKHSRGPMLLAIMLVGIVAAIGFGAFYILYFQTKNEEKLAAQAEEEYKKASYADAAKTYEKLTREHPGSRDIEKYKFFADLASMQTVVRGVTNREDYEAAVKRLDEFIAAQKDSPLAKPTSGFGHDVLAAGKQLGEAIADHAEDRVKAFQADHGKSGEVARAEKAVAAGRALVVALDPFRGPDDPPLDGIRNRLDATEKAVKRERDRAAAVAGAREQLESPTDAVIQDVEAKLGAGGWLDDAEVQQLIAAAKGKLRDLVKYEDDPAERQAPPPTAASSLLFVTPIGKTKAREVAPNDLPPAVFLCVARGILYALDENSGDLLWAARVGPDVTDPPAVARVDPNNPTDIAVVTSNVGNAPAVAGHVLRTGVTRWYQPLPAPAAGPAVVVGTRAFVPVRDAVGTVFEFDLTGGARIGRIRLGQPVAERGAVLRPGTNLLYVAADARRLYVIDTGGKNDDGARVSPRCAQVIATGHLSGTLRVPPLFIGPEGTEPADRWMVLAQAEGTAKTMLRAFAVGPIPAPPAPGESVPETPAAHAVALPVPGWVAYPPTCDGERLAVASDTGQFRLFGVNQPGNADKTLFPFPVPSDPPLPAEKTTPGLVIPVEESTYWVLAAGQLRRARLTLVPSKGQAVVFSGPRVPLGEPVHAGQLNARKDVACVVVRSPNSSGCRAVAIGTRDGEVRWERQLGIVPAKMSADQLAPPISQAGKFVLVDEGGGIAALPAGGGAVAGRTVPAVPDWVAPPPPDATGSTFVAASADGKTVYTVTPVNREGPKFVVRRVADGKKPTDDVVVAPAAMAGHPAIVGGALLLPTADGFVNRLVPGAGLTRPASLVAGPPWLGDRRPAHPVCCITPLTDSTFATSDGGKRLSRWDWPEGGSGKWTLANAWDVRQEVTVAGVALPPAAAGEPPRLAVADASGSVWLYASDRAGPHLRRWSPGEGGIPPGRPSSALVAQSGAGRQVVVYAVDGKTAVALDPDARDALWTRSVDDAAGALVGAPQPAGDDRWVLTDLTGRVVVLDGATGGVLAVQSVGLP
ncbi:MAG: hypothetical protein J0I06_26570, partial [Planctomycetes bacterium]|nr:hypothetical protein [Planctomycetota bacterium]